MDAIADKLREVKNPAWLDNALEDARADLYRGIFNATGTHTEPLYVNMIAALLITLGILFAEKSTESRHPSFLVRLGRILFPIGWALLLVNSPKAAVVGVLIPVWAAVGQAYFGRLMQQSQLERSDGAMMTAFILMVFMALWAVFLFVGHNNKYAWTGLMLLMAGMMLYFRDRRFHMTALMGQSRPRATTLVDGALMFHPGVALVAAGWGFLAVGLSTGWGLGIAALGA